MNLSSLAARVRPLPLGLALAGLACAASLALVPAAGAGPLATLAPCKGSDHPVYALEVTGGAPCGAAFVVSSRLANRFNAPGDFAGQVSTVRITQKDALGRTYRCSWNSGSTRNDIVNWFCTSKTNGGMGWIWRKHRL